MIVLRHQLAVLRRQVDRPEITDADRSLLGAIAAALARPSRAGRLVSPDTLLRWHRRRIVGHWTQPQRPPSRPRPQQSFADSHCVSQPRIRPGDTAAGTGNSAVVVDLPRCGPVLIPNLVPIPGPRMERETRGQRRRPNYGHPQARLATLGQLAAVGAGPPAARLFRRCRTASWWRRTMISRSFARPSAQPGGPPTPRIGTRCDT